MAEEASRPYPEWFKQYEEFVKPEDVRFRYLKRNRYMAIIPFLYTTAIIVGDSRNPTFYEDRWCYETMEAAMKAFDKWDGASGTEPSGWHRHPNSGRRRPDGIESAQYVNP